mmetsp:Transcript_18666/g.42388  ORF Transcript_18666/g.42388 Transcript_18666/m.42388 type:complete len:84 (+) Transcript_18666:253-504(+)
MDKLAAEVGDKAIFLMVNTRGIADAKEYKEKKGLTDACIHGGNRPPAEYGLKYIPHKTIIDKEGKIVKNFENVDLAADVKALL